MARQCVVIHPCLSKELRVVEYMLDDASCLLGNPVVSLPPTMTSLKYIYQAQFECPTQISWLSGNRGAAPNTIAKTLHAGQKRGHVISQPTTGPLGPEF